MKVKELIEKLKEFDPEEIIYMCNEGAAFEVKIVEKREEITNFERIYGKAKPIYEKVIIIDDII